MPSVSTAVLEIENKKESVKNTYSYDEAFEKSLEYFEGDDLAAKVVVDKYLLRDNEQNLLEATPDDMHWRIAKEFARIEKKKFKEPLSTEDIFSYLDHFKRIIPQGSPLYGIGNDYQTITLSNCYVIDSPMDAYSSIMRADEHLVQISKRRGGCGIDISNIRPGGAIVRNAARTSTGIIPFMERYSHSIREVGQCLHEDTDVLCFDGIKKIKDIVSGEQVWTENGWVPVWNVIKNKKHCVKITTQSGKTLICSKDHKIHTPNGEKKAGSLKSGDIVTQIIGHGWEGKEIMLGHAQYDKVGSNKSSRLNEDISLPEIMNKDLAYLLGYSYGDGYVGRQEGRLSEWSLATSEDWPDIEDKLVRIIYEQFEYAPKIKTATGGRNNSVRVCSRYIIHFLKSNELLKQKTESIVFPEQLLLAHVDIICAFIAGYFDADGCAQQSKKVYKFASISKDFLKTIQKVFLALGIVSRIHRQTRSEQGWKDMYTLSVNGGRSQELFRKYLFESVKVLNTDNWDKKRDFSRTNYKITDFGSRSGKHTAVMANDSWLTYSTAVAVIDELERDDDVLLLHDKVSVIDDDVLCNTYDLQLENTHFFWANGIYVKNSGRRGALMITLSVHHPEVLEFAEAKKDLTKITGANISIRLTNEFLDAVSKDEDYEVRWPVDARENGEEPKVARMVSARKIWMTIVENARNHAEPGLLFWDNIINESPADCYKSFGYKTLSTNPCSELPLSPADSCRLLILNLFTYVKNPFKKTAFFDFDEFYKDAQIAQRLMDDMVDLELEKIDKIIAKVRSDPEPDNVKQVELNLWKDIKKACTNGRRTGTGITALGDAIAALGLKYGSDKSIEVVENIYRTMKLGCYRSSVDMAKEIGSFSVWDHELEKDNSFLLRIKDEDEELWKDMKKYGRRNIALLTTAPVGSCSILTQTSSGIEPVFMLGYKRRKKITPGDDNPKIDFVDQSGDKWQEFTVYHPKIKMWMDVTGKDDIEKSPWFGCCAEDLKWTQRVKLQASAQRHVDHSISSTLNLPEDVTTEKVAEIYETAWKLGTKGITIYRKNCRTGVLVEDKDERENGHIEKTTAPKRPKELPSEVYFTTVKGDHYFVVVGSLPENNEPYEIFVGNNGFVSKRGSLKGIITKEKRGVYNASFEGDIELRNISKYCSDEEEALTRMVSTALRHGADVSFVVHQLEKAKGDLQSPAKAIGRVLKRYVADGTKITGEACPGCGGSNLERSSGCCTCRDCSWSKCS